MSRHDRTPRSGSDRTNLYDEITGKIIAELEAGQLPWVQPWGSSAARAPLGASRPAPPRPAEERQHRSGL